MDKQTFIEQYAPLAIEQQKKYGIPASVTLAQAIIESSWGKNIAATQANNYFGVHASKSWIQSGKPTVSYSDDNKVVPFCKYGSVSESFMDHSKVLMNKHYMHCRKYDSTDYKAWCYGLQSGESTGGKYAGGTNYSQKLISLIEQNGLAKYDQIAVAQAKAEGITIGYARDNKMSPSSNPSVTQQPPSANVDLVPNSNAHWSFPLQGMNGELVVTSGYGHRHAPTQGASTDHNGLDLRAKYVPILATEDNGKVVDVKSDSKSGKLVRVEYDRSDGTKYRVSYAHLDSIDVKVGDTVNAGQVLGKSGASGLASKPGSGPHLHFVVRKVEANGKSNYVDPTKYLAEIAVRGNIQTKLVMKGDASHKDTLAQYKPGVDLKVQPVIPAVDQPLVAQNDNEGVELTEQQRQNAEAGARLAAQAGTYQPASLLQMLLGSQADQLGLSPHDNRGLIEQLLSGLFMTAMTLAAKLDFGQKYQSQDMFSAEQLQQQETPEKQAELVVKRQRERQQESVDAKQLQEFAMNDFDANYPEQKEDRGQRIG